MIQRGNHLSMTSKIVPDWDWPAFEEEKEMDWPK
jgi:hypothetical protein